MFTVCFDVKAELATSGTLQLSKWSASNVRKQRRLYAGLIRHTRYHSVDLLPAVTCENATTHGDDKCYSFTEIDFG